MFDIKLQYVVQLILWEIYYMSFRTTEKKSFFDEDNNYLAQEKILDFHQNAKEFIRNNDSNDIETEQKQASPEEEITDEQLDDILGKLYNEIGNIEELEMSLSDIMDEEVFTEHNRKERTKKEEQARLRKEKERKNKASVLEFIKRRLASNKLNELNQTRGKEQLEANLKRSMRNQESMLKDSNMKETSAREASRRMQDAQKNANEMMRKQTSQQERMQTSMREARRSAQRENVARQQQLNSRLAMQNRQANLQQQQANSRRSELARLRALRHSIEAQQLANNTNQQMRLSLLRQSQNLIKIIRQGLMATQQVIANIEQNRIAQQKLDNSINRLNNINKQIVAVLVSLDQGKINSVSVAMTDKSGQLGWLYSSNVVSNNNQFYKATQVANDSLSKLSCGGCGSCPACTGIRSQQNIMHNVDSKKLLGLNAETIANGSEYSPVSAVNKQDALSKVACSCGACPSCLGITKNSRVKYNNNSNNILSIKADQPSDSVDKIDELRAVIERERQQMMMGA